jgi:hypothetical protein
MMGRQVDIPSRLRAEGQAGETCGGCQGMDGT